MKILAIDTSTTSGSVALLEGEHIIAEVLLNIGKTHSIQLLPSIYQLLRDAEFDPRDVSCFVITTGPGSFTGLKVGLSTVKGLAWATERPIVGVSTLLALAYNLSYAEKMICPILDARKNEVYAALFRGNGRNITRIFEDTVLPPERLVELIEEETLFLGSGLGLYASYLRDRLGKRAIFAPPYLWSIRASIVGNIGLRGFFKGEGQDPGSILPEYIRPSEAEVKRLKGKEKVSLSQKIQNKRSKGQ